MFSEGDNSNNPPSLYLLNLANGTVQKELQPVPGSSTSYYPHVWIDNTHVTLLAVDSVNGSEDVGIYLLDTNGGANQQNSKLQLIAKDSTLFTFDFDINPDHTAFVIGKSSNLSPFPSSISVLPIMKGSEHTIYASQTYEVLVIRVVSNTTVLFYLSDPSGTNATDKSGLYKIYMDGTGFTKLIGNDNTPNVGGQPPAIEVSHDKSMYALELSGVIGGTGTCGHQCSYSLIRFGSLNGGTPTTIPTPTTTPNTNSNPSLVGWTTM